MPKQKTESIELEFSKDKETKNTVRFEEQVEEDQQPVVGMLYLKKAKLKELGDPEDITVTIVPADD